MYVVCERLHVWELLVRQNIASRISPEFPCVVDVDVDVTDLIHATGYDCVGHRAYRSIVDLSGEFIPAVPAHRRCACKAVVGHIFKCGQSQWLWWLRCFLCHFLRKPLHGAIATLNRERELAARIVALKYNRPLLAAVGGCRWLRRKVNGTILKCASDRYLLLPTNQLPMDRRTVLLQLKVSIPKGAIT